MASGDCAKSCHLGFSSRPFPRILHEFDGDSPFSTKVSLRSNHNTLPNFIWQFWKMPFLDDNQSQSIWILGLDANFALKWRGDKILSFFFS